MITGSDLRFGIVLLALSLMSVGPAAAQTGVSELEGAWDAISVTERGRPTRTLPPGQVSFTFKGDRLILVGVVGGPAPAAEVNVAFTVDSSVTPKHLDYWQDPAQKTLCLYELKGDTLRLALPAGPSGQRAPRISGDEGSQAMLLELRRRR